MSRQVTTCKRKKRREAKNTCVFATLRPHNNRIQSGCAWRVLSYHILSRSCVSGAQSRMPPNLRPLHTTTMQPRHACQHITPLPPLAHSKERHSTTLGRTSPQQPRNTHRDFEDLSFGILNPVPSDANRFPVVPGTRGPPALRPPMARPSPFLDRRAAGMAARVDCTEDHPHVHEWYEQRNTNHAAMHT